MVSGVLITLLGHYIPFMWLGSILVTIGAGLMTTLQNTSPSSSIIGFQLLAGLGAGLSNQIPFSAVQMAVAKDQVVIGSALVSLCNSLGTILGVAIAQPLFVTELVVQLQKIKGINAIAVARAGPVDLQKTVSPQALELAREALGLSLGRPFILVAVSGGLAFCCSLAMEWRKLS